MKHLLRTLCALAPLPVAAPPFPLAAQAVCEPQPGARCWYVAADAASRGAGSFDAPFRIPQDAVSRAAPGDVIYLRGGAEFTHDHLTGDRLRERIMAMAPSESAAGEPGRPITVRSYPGEQAVIRGRFENHGDLVIQITSSHWRVEGLRLYAGRIVIGHGTQPGSGPRVRDVWIVGNTLTDVVARWSNYGVITIHGQHTQAGPGTWDDDLDPADVFIHRNTIRNVWVSPSQDRTQPPIPWYEDRDPEHNACFALLKSGGLVELVGNEFSECTNIFYSKWTGPGPTIVRDNYFHTARQIANRWRSSRPVFENNRFARFQRPFGSLNISQGDVRGAVFRGNTFDLGPWERNPAGARWAVGWNELGGHTFRDNVVLAPEYHRISAAFEANDVDGNCVIWSGDLVAARSRGAAWSWQEYRSAFGHDRDGVLVTATGAAAVFAEPAAGDYTLIGDAAAACPGKGAR